MPVLFTVGGLAALIVLFLVKKMPKIRAVAALLFGMGIAYGSTHALVTHLATAAAHAALSGGGKVGELLFGITVGGFGTLIVLSMTFLVGHDLWPKHSAKMRTTFIALLLPIIAANAGGAISHAADTTRTSIVQTANMQGR